MPLDVNNQSPQDIWHSALNVFKSHVQSQNHIYVPSDRQVGMFTIQNEVRLNLFWLRFFHPSLGDYQSHPTTHEELLDLLTHTFIEEVGQRPSWLMPGYEYGYRWDNNQHRFRRALRNGTTVQWE